MGVRGEDWSHKKRLNSFTSSTGAMEKRCLLLLCHRSVHLWLWEIYFLICLFLMVVLGGGVEKESMQPPGFPPFLIPLNPPACLLLAFRP